MNNKGKIMIIGIAAVIIVFDLFILVNAAIGYYMSDMPGISITFIISGLIRVFIYFLEFYLMYKRKKWARIIIEILFTLRVFSGILSLVIKPTFLHTMSTVIFAVSGILLFSKSINLYMNNYNYTDNEENLKI